MKKTGILIFVLLALLATTALAQTTGIALNGKVYTFTGGNGTYAEDGMTFIIEDDGVTVILEDGNQLNMPLSHADEGDAVSVKGVMVESAGDESQIYFTYAEDDAAVVSGSAFSTEVTITATDCEAMTSFAYESAAVYSDEDFAAYAAYGLDYDEETNTLAYQGRRVRIMEDVIPIDAYSSSCVEWLDWDGEVDVRAVRNEAGQLVGMEVLSDEDFTARDLSDWTAPAHESMVMEATANESCDALALGRAELFAPYAAFGLRYDAETDTIYYGDKIVGHFLDIRTSNGMALDSGLFEGSITQINSDQGEVDVTTIRDYDQPDANGEGKLLGLIVRELD